MSLAETQQIYDILVKIDQLLSNIENKIQTVESSGPRALTKITDSTEITLSSFRKLERISIRVLALHNRMGLPENVNGAIDKLMQLLSIIRMVTIAQSMLLATNPLTVGLGIIGMAAAGGAMYDFMSEGIYDSQRGR